MSALPTMGLIRAGWDTYQRGVLPANAPDVQRIETRRAYYAGVKVMIDVLKGIGEPEISEAAGVVALADCDEEIAQFLREVKEGRA